jgi:uncharacterized membrane protein YqaE (UPF0057 family)
VITRYFVVGVHLKDIFYVNVFTTIPGYMTGILVAIYADEDISENLDESKTL